MHRTENTVTKGDSDMEYEKMTFEFVLSADERKKFYELYLQTDFTDFGMFLNACIGFNLESHIRKNAETFIRVYDYQRQGER